MTGCPTIWVKQVTPALWQIERADGFLIGRLANWPSAIAKAVNMAGVLAPQHAVLTRDLRDYHLIIFMPECVA